jgi:hypothetical protein
MKNLLREEEAFGDNGQREVYRNTVSAGVPKAPALRKGGYPRFPTV